jgi:hypothetical protein
MTTLRVHFINGLEKVYHAKASLLLLNNRLWQVQLDDNSVVYLSIANLLEVHETEG